jgi:hypothetical protein
MTGRTTLSVFYGINVKTRDDPYLAISEEALSETAQTFLTTAGLVVRLWSPYLLRNTITDDAASARI